MLFGNRDPYRKLKKRIGERKVLDRKEDRMVYAVDASYTAPPGNHDPDLVVLAESTEDVVQTVKFAREAEIPIVPRGMGSGMSAGAVPLGGGLVLVTERMKRIINLDPGERWIECETGLSCAAVKEEAARHQLFYPPDPSSYKISSIGGNLAENAGGLRCVKYGTTKDYVLGLEFVDAEGEVVRTGEMSQTRDLLDLTTLLIGSEGLLGVITACRLRLIPPPKATYTQIAHFPSVEHAVGVIHAMMPEVVPSVLEFMDDSVIEAIRGHDPYPFPEGTQAALLVETDGDPQAAQAELERVYEIFEEFEALEIHTARAGAERERLWNLRRLVSPSLSRLASGKMNEDVVVPIGRMGQLLARTSDISRLYNIRIPVYGHAGDGNLHLNAMYDKTEPKQVRAAHEAIEKCFEEVVRLGGTITGEHGVGASKRREMKLQFKPEDLHVFREVKRAMDPTGVFNPHKLIPAE